MKEPLRKLIIEQINVVPKISTRVKNWKKKCSPRHDHGNKESGQIKSIESKSKLTMVPPSRTSSLALPSLSIMVAMLSYGFLMTWMNLIGTPTTC